MGDLTAADAGFKLGWEADDHFMVENAQGQAIPIPKKELTEEFQNQIRALPMSQQPQAGVSPTPIPGTSFENITNATPATLQATPIPTPPMPVMPVEEPKMEILPNTPTHVPAPVQQAAPKDPYGFGQQLAGIQGVANAQSEGQKAVAEQAKAQAQQLEMTRNFYAQRRADLDAQTNQLEQDVKNHKINPNQFWEQKTGVKGGVSRVMAMIGLFLGGGQSAQILDNFIARNIDSQKTELDKKKNLLHQNMQKYGDLNQAEQATRLDIMNMFNVQLQQLAAQTQSQVVKEQAKTAAGQLQMQMGLMKDNLAKEGALKQLNNLAANSILPDQALTILPTEVQERMVRIGENQNVLARTKKDADELKESEPAVKSALKLIDELENDIRGGKTSTALFGDIPLLAEATDTGREGRDRQTEISNALREIGKSLRINEYTNENFVKRLIPNPAQWKGSKDEEIGDLQRLRQNLLDRVNQARAAKLMTYNPADVAPSAKKGVAR